MRKKIVAGNWKMNLDRNSALSLATEIKGMLADEYTGTAEVIIAPSFVFLGSLVQLLKGSTVSVAAQNCAAEKEGAFTGEVSADMLVSMGVTHVIIGHSERRSIFQETNSSLKEKVERAHEAGLKIIFCVGESLDNRESGNYIDVVRDQLSASLFSCKSVNPENTIIAYEPVWAIGTGKTASPDQVQEMHCEIRKMITQKYSHDLAEKFTILYGGSCNEKNASEIFGQADVDGGLIGGASLKSRSFVSIIKTYNR